MLSYFVIHRDFSLATVFLLIVVFIFPAWIPWDWLTKNTKAHHLVVSQRGFRLECHLNVNSQILKMHDMAICSWNMTRIYRCNSHPQTMKNFPCRPEGWQWVILFSDSSLCLTHYVVLFFYGIPEALLISISLGWPFAKKEAPRKLKEKQKPLLIKNITVSRWHNQRVMGNVHYKDRWNITCVHTGLWLFKNKPKLRILYDFKEF